MAIHILTGDDPCLDRRGFGRIRRSRRRERGEAGEPKLPGYVLKPAIVAVAALAAGTYLITSEKYGPGARAGGIVLVFVGAITALPALAILFGMSV